MLLLWLLFGVWGLETWEHGNGICLGEMRKENVAIFSLMTSFIDDLSRITTGLITAI